MDRYQELLKKHGYCEALCGVNEEYENVMLSIDKESACVRTLQKNGWIRINIYHKDGTYEELYEH